MYRRCLRTAGGWPAGSCSRLLEDARQACHRFRCSSAHQQAGQPASRACSSNSNRELCKADGRSFAQQHTRSDSCKDARRAGSGAAPAATHLGCGGGSGRAGSSGSSTVGVELGNSRVRFCSSTGCCCCCCCCFLQAHSHKHTTGLRTQGAAARRLAMGCPPPGACRQVCEELCG